MKVSILRPLGNGLIGAGILTLAHLFLKHIAANPPKMDVLGKHGMEKLLGTAGISITQDQLFNVTLIGDFLTNTIYFSQVRDKTGLLALARGFTCGCIAGAGAVALSAKSGMDGDVSHKTMRTTVVTISLYGLAGLASALAAQFHGKSK
jgi:hypothetical protein